MIEHYLHGVRVYTTGEASEILHVAGPTLRQRVKRMKITARGWINPREPVYRLEDLTLDRPTQPRPRPRLPERP